MISQVIGLDESNGILVPINKGRSSRMGKDSEFCSGKIEVSVGHDGIHVQKTAVI